MVNVYSSSLMLLLFGGGNLLINKNNRNLVYILCLLTLWLIVHVETTLLYQILTVTLLLSFKTKSLLLFYIFYELRVVPIFLIIYIKGYQPEKLQAALSLLLYTVVGSLPLFLYILTQELGVVSSILSLPITLGFIVKTPLYILHTWLPKAHVEAPIGGSMVLAGIMLKLGTYGLCLFLPSVKFNFLLNFYFSISVIGSVLCSLICLRQGDIKVLIAYSSVVHMGVVSLSLLGGKEQGYMRRIMIVVAHGLTSPFLFNFSYSLYGSSHSRMLLNNMTQCPLASFLLMGLVALNMSLPPRLGVWSEVSIIICCFDFFARITPLLFLTILLAAIYNLYLYVSVAHSKTTNNPVDIVPLPYLQVFFLGYASVITLDLFHL